MIITERLLGFVNIIRCDGSRDYGVHFSSFFLLVTLDFNYCSSALFTVICVYFRYVVNY